MRGAALTVEAARPAMMKEAIAPDILDFGLMMPKRRCDNEKEIDKKVRK